MRCSDRRFFLSCKERLRVEVVFKYKVLSNLQYGTFVFLMIMYTKKDQINLTFIYANIYKPDFSLVLFLNITSKVCQAFTALIGLCTHSCGL